MNKDQLLELEMWIAACAGWVIFLLTPPKTGYEEYFSGITVVLGLITFFILHFIREKDSKNIYALKK